MLHADNIKDNSTCVNGKWVVARPLPFYGIWGYWYRCKDAWAVLKGKADAVKFYKQ